MSKSGNGLKEHEHEFPVLTAVTRDILSIPTTGASVERLFNTARDACHYRRGSLNSTTIQDIMMFRCTSRFDVKTEEYKEVLLSLEAVRAADEQSEAHLSLVDHISISDGEDVSDKDKDEDNNVLLVIQDEFTSTSQREDRYRSQLDVQEDNTQASQKRQSSMLAESDDDNDHPLPDNSGTQRRAGLRDARKRCKTNDP
ncbi:HAT dimerization [Penicillium soppii]|uniref:HAT dimerization n=1 Tax=Penicillium soppii TaxID=69789 RepID=UPI002549535F|nr:HAT dimerization [Penicillium soppii]KAJ5861936.1 HAT dimerization [Penicillium soppii]